MGKITLEKVASLTEFKQTEQTGKMRFGLVKYLESTGMKAKEVNMKMPNAIPDTQFDLNYTSYLRWRRISGPQYFGLKTTLTNEVSITDAISTTKTLESRISATVEAGIDAGAASFKASLTADTSSSLSFQESRSTTVTNTRQVEIPEKSYITEWVLERVVRLVGNRPGFTIRLFGGDNGAINMPQTAVDETFIIPINTYRDVFTKPNPNPKS